MNLTQLGDEIVSAHLLHIRVQWIGQVSRRGKTISDAQTNRVTRVANVEQPVARDVFRLQIVRLGQGEKDTVVGTSRAASELVDGRRLVLELEGVANEHDGLDRVHGCSVIREIVERRNGQGRSLGVSQQGVLLVWAVPETLLDEPLNVVGSISSSLESRVPCSWVHGVVLAAARHGGQGGANHADKASRWTLRFTCSSSADEDVVAA